MSPKATRIEESEGHRWIRLQAETRSQFHFSDWACQQGREGPQRPGSSRGPEANPHVLFSLIPGPGERRRVCHWAGQFGVFSVSIAYVNNRGTTKPLSLNRKVQNTSLLTPERRWSWFSQWFKSIHARVSLMKLTAKWHELLGFCRNIPCYRRYTDEDSSMHCLKRRITKVRYLAAFRRWMWESSAIPDQDRSHTPPVPVEINQWDMMSWWWGWAEWKRRSGMI